MGDNVCSVAVMIDRRGLLLYSEWASSWRHTPGRDLTEELEELIVLHMYAYGHMWKHLSYILYLKYETLTKVQLSAFVVQKLSV